MPATAVIALEGAVIERSQELIAFYELDINLDAMNDLTTVPRLGAGAKTSLEAAGIKTVKQLIGMFLVKETKDAFEEWLVGCGVQKASNNSGGIAIAINNWCGSNGY